MFAMHALQRVVNWLSLPLVYRDRVAQTATAASPVSPSLLISPMQSLSPVATPPTKPTEPLPNLPKPLRTFSIP